MPYTARLLEHRRRAGLSQDELSEKSGVDRPAISNYERMRREPHPRRARALAGALGVEVEDLYYSAEMERPRLGMEYGNALKAARQHGGYPEELALLGRFAREIEDTDPIAGVYEAHRREAEFLQAISHMDLRHVPRGAATLIRAYVQLLSGYVAAGASIPAGMARGLVTSLQDQRPPHTAPKVRGEKTASEMVSEDRS